MDIHIANHECKRGIEPLPKSMWRSTLNQVNGHDFKNEHVFDESKCSRCGGKGLYEEHVKLTKVRIKQCNCEKLKEG